MGSPIGLNSQNLMCLYDGNLVKKVCRASLIAGLAVTFLPSVLSYSATAISVFVLSMFAQSYFDKNLFH